MSASARRVRILVKNVVNWLKTSAWWPSPTSSLEILEQHLDLCCRHVCVRVVDQRRVEAEPAQQGQRAEHREPVAIKIFDQSQDLLPFALQMRLVDPPMPGVQLDLDDLLLLGRQLGCDALLGAAQHQRADPPAQLAQSNRVLAALDRSPVVLRETIRIREKPWRGDREQCPEVHQAVFQRGAGDRQLERGRDAAGALVGLGAVVLHELCLVEDAARTTPAR